MAFPSCFRSILPSLAVLALAGLLTGCYTQLATRGYGAAEAPAYGPLPDSAAGDSVLAERSRDYRDAPPVIVNHYYQPGLAYRGYAHWEWDYPALTLGYYSSRYSHFSRPYWWDDPYYYRRPSHRHGHHHHHHGGGDYRPAPGGGGSAAPRLLSPEPDYRRPSKGRRSEPAPVSAPAPSPSPAPKQGGDGGSSSSGSASGSSASPSSGSESQGGSSGEQDGEYRSLRKGKRR